MPRKDDARTVYTTETGRTCSNCGQPVAACRCKKATTRPKGDGVVRVALEKGGRGGKLVSVITGVPGNDDDLRALAAELKRRCGTGGTVKDAVIEIQGDQRDLLVELLKGRGWTVKRVGG